MSNRFLAFLLALVLLAASLLPASGEALPAPKRVETLLQSLVQSEMARAGATDVQAWADGPLAGAAGQGAEWTILALAQLKGCGLFPPYDLTAYRDSLTAFLSRGATYGASTRQKYALCMLAAGGDAAVAEATEATIGQQGIMSWVYGLHLLNNGCQSSQYTAMDVAERLIGMQKPDGGWALMGQAADVDVTAMVLQALAPHRDDPTVGASAEAAVALLADRQQEDGGFVSMGQPNPESAAQVMIALCALGIDPLTDERFQKNGFTMLDSILAYRLPDGGYSHAMGGAYSASTTVQVLDALTAYTRFARGMPGLYLLDQAAGWAAQTQAMAATPVDVPAAAPVDASAGTVSNEKQPAVSATEGTAISSASPDASVGIIGGADGPTAIFLSGADSWKPAAIIAIVALTAVRCLFSRRRGKLKNVLVTGLLAAALIGLVLGLDIQSPERYYGGSSAPGGEIVGTVTLEIRCDMLTGIASGEYIPADGVILPKTAFGLRAGDTVYDLLTEAARQRRLHLDASGGDGMKYVRGLHHLYEQAYGELSGWLYFVNGVSASQGCDQYLLTDGDHVSWQYSLEMGRDLE